jgi:hypothetical protein
MVKMPMGADPDEAGDDYARAAQIGRNIRVDEQGAIIIPPPNGPEEVNRWDVSLMSAGNAQVFMALNSTIQEYDTKVLMAVLAQFIILGINKVGSQSKAETDVSFFTMAVNAFTDDIAATFTNTEVKRLLRLNGRDPNNIAMEHSPAGDVNADMMIELIKAIGGKVNWTPEDEVQIRSMFKLPEKTIEQVEEEEEINAARRKEIARQMPQQPRPFAQADDDMTAYAANAPDNAPDERDRQRMMNSWRATFDKFFPSQRNRITKGVKEL